MDSPRLSPLESPARSLYVNMITWSSPSSLQKGRAFDRRRAWVTDQSIFNTQLHPEELFKYQGRLNCTRARRTTSACCNWIPPVFYQESELNMRMCSYCSASNAKGAQRTGPCVGVARAKKYSGVSQAQRKNSSQHILSRTCMRTSNVLS